VQQKPYFFNPFTPLTQLTEGVHKDLKEAFVMLNWNKDTDKMAVLHFLRLSLHHSLKSYSTFGSSASLVVRSKGQGARER